MHSYSVLFLLCLLLVAVSADLESLGELYKAIETGSNRKVGFISQANYDSVHTVLPSNTEAVIVEHTDELVEMVRNGTLVAGLLSGVPPNEDKALHTFTSTLISPRAVLLSKDANAADMNDAIDAAIVRIQKASKDHAIARSNPPFEFVAIRTCRSDDEAKFPFPAAGTATGTLAAALTARTFTMSALGPSDWGNDGDYTATPPTGYWPDYVRALEAELKTAYGTDIKITRQWHTSSAGVMNAIANGQAHFTEPYMTVDAFHNGRSRKSSFERSCTTLGYDSTFFTRRSPPVAVDDTVPVGVIAGGVIAGVVAVILAAFVVYLVMRERRGKPVFEPLVATENRKAPVEPGTVTGKPIELNIDG
eukprot:TRINITY_DN62959_c0_g1_i1.p1 TRINITY_DN62959_c0_g1~~TRINITY_DN62959_c0_g1_i1.p1  ORF type:complete len:363 (-),score=56.29 TRINITY_DN62959_c0_g1_i1:60-1148(-)